MRAWMVGLCGVIASGAARAQPVSAAAGDAADGAGQASAARSADGAAAALPASTEALEGSIDPARYVLGPGDRLRIVLWGLQELQPRSR